PDFIIRKSAQRFLALSLIATSVYQTIAAYHYLNRILPLLQTVNTSQLADLKTSLIKQAVVVSSGLFIDSFYGFALLIKPSHTVSVVHFILGVLLFIFSNLLFQFVI
ncbi:hypothetical protein KKH13_00770, partial [Patescibacteria group bacterium]|nr:hypothetical protein [Patescibacteria group bacterium]